MILNNGGSASNLLWKGKTSLDYFYLVIDQFHCFVGGFDCAAPTAFDDFPTRNCLDTAKYLLLKYGLYLLVRHDRRLIFRRSRQAESDAFNADARFPSMNGLTKSMIRSRKPESNKKFLGFGIAMNGVA